ncbi:hypothetical protein QUA71_14405 [Microcoleus sp. MON1_C5]|uniref:hypothetical protein n=1 Tax=Microcoleus sp. MON1_C5 TaxID=2818828 RepID=UPI002FD45CBB
MATPQENALVVEQAGKPVLENGARCEMLPTAKVDEFIDRCQTTGATAAVREFREWVKNQ